MSDSDESGVTYTEVSSPFEGLSDIGSPRADDHEYLELPWMPEDPYVEAALQAPPSPDYVPGPEEPEQAPPSPDYVPGPEHADDEIVAEDQPYAEDASPTAQSPDYVPESDPEADPEEDDDEDPEEDPVDYPADGGDDGDDEDEPSEEDEDDDVDIEADEDEEEEEHPAPADSVVVALPATDQAPSAEETEPFETDESAATPPPHPAYRVTARISIPAPVPTPVWSDAEVARLLAISTPPSSPLSPWSSPLPHIPSLPLPPIPSPSLPLSPPSPVLSPAPPPSPIRSLGYRAAMIRLRAEAASTSYSLPLPPPFILSPTRSDAPSLGIPPPLPISVPTSSPPLLLPSASRREDRPEVTLPPRKRLGIALGPRYEVGESSSVAAARPAGGLRADYGFVATMDREIRRDPEREVGYGITDSWDEIVETLQGAPVSTDTELGQGKRLDFRDAECRTQRRYAEMEGTVTTYSDSVYLIQVITWGPVGGYCTTKATRGGFGSSLRHVMQTGVARQLHCWENGWQKGHERIVRECTYQDFKVNDKYCPRNEIEKARGLNCGFETEGSLMSIGTTECFQELALLYLPKPENQCRGLVETAANLEYILCALRKRHHHWTGEKKPYGDLRPYALNANYPPRMVMVLQNATNANKFGILLCDVGVRECNMLTIGDGIASGPESTCLSVESKDTSKRRMSKAEEQNKNLIFWMDWLAKYQAIIVCAEKIVRIPLGNETLIIHGHESNQGHKAHLYIILYSKTQEYMLKGCPAFLAHVTTNEVEDKSEKKRLRYTNSLRFSRLGSSLTRQVEFQIHLIPGAAPVARAPYRLAPSEMKIELLEQLKELLTKALLRLVPSPWGAPAYLSRRKRIILDGALIIGN
ncbi:hypothetical protein Tco_0019836 [Tanacetum coccineum]